MPAKKPAALHVRHDTKADREARILAENRTKSERDLPAEAPVALRNHKDAQAVWRRVIREYNALEGKLVSRLDMDMLMDYCVVVEQIHELDAMRKAAYQQWLELGPIAQDSKENLAQARTKGIGLKTQSELEQLALKWVNQVNEAFETVVKLDSRVDRKRSLAMQYMQSLYMTPRSRAGVVPDGKEIPEEPDDMDKLLSDQFEQLVNAQAGSDD